MVFILVIITGHQATELGDNDLTSITKPVAVNARTVLPRKSAGTLAESQLHQLHLTPFNGMNSQVVLWSCRLCDAPC